MNKILFTKEGYKKTKDLYETLLKKRKTAVCTLKKAREMGDLSENGYYKAAKFELSSIDRELRKLKHLISESIVKEPNQKESIDIGLSFTITTNNKSNTYMLVGEYESDPLEGKISHKSPLGQKLYGKKKGDVITIQVPKGAITYQIKNVFLAA